MTISFYNNRTESSKTITFLKVDLHPLPPFCLTSVYLAPGPAHLKYSPAQLIKHCPAVIHFSYVPPLGSAPPSSCMMSSWGHWLFRVQPGCSSNDVPLAPPLNEKLCLLGCVKWGTGGTCLGKWHTWGSRPEVSYLKKVIKKNCKVKGMSDGDEASSYWGWISALRPIHIIVVH